MKSVHPISIIREENREKFSKEDLLVVEEPLEIRVGYGKIEERQQKSVSVTMRTPGHDFELALGFLFTEGIIDKIDDVVSIDYCADAGKQEERENIVRVELNEGVSPNISTLDRNFYMTSSCGVCGKSSIDSVKVNCTPITNGNVQVPSEVIQSLLTNFSKKQTVFEYTGGLHACALFDLQGEIFGLREDVGRHNALDKIIGASLIKKELPLQNNILVLSGRAGFELIQKAGRASIPIVAAVGAPTSLSVELANDLNITLIGFLRNTSFNIYSGQQRVN